MEMSSQLERARKAAATSDTETVMVGTSNRASTPDHHEDGSRASRSQASSSRPTGSVQPPLSPALRPASASHQQSSSLRELASQEIPADGHSNRPDNRPEDDALQQLQYQVDILSTEIDKFRTERDVLRDVLEEHRPVRTLLGDDALS